MESEFLTVTQVARELDMSRSGVYKLIRQQKIGVVRLSERGTRVSRIALDAYRKRVHADARLSGAAVQTLGTAAQARLQADFEQLTGLAPEAWMQAWDGGQIEDSAENMARTIDAQWLLLQEQRGHVVGPGDQPPAVGSAGLAAA